MEARAAPMGTPPTVHPEPRILHLVATTQLRGAETFAADLVEALNGLGSGQAVAVLRPSAGGVRFEAPTLALPRGWGIPGLRVEGRAVVAIRRLGQGGGFDVIQAHGGEPFKHAVVAGVGLPVVYRKIGLASPWIASAPRRRAYAGMMRRASRVIAVAEEIRSELIEVFGVPPDKVVTIATGRDRRPFEVAGGDKARAASRKALGVAPESEVILSLMSLTPEKDPVGHVRVIHEVLRRRPASLFVVAGDGPLRPGVERAVAGLGLDGRVRLLGSRPEVPELLAAADLVLLASRSEGTPSCLIEAGMAGLPSVAYDVGGVGEVVVDGETGLLSAPGDSLSLARNVGRLLEDPALRRAMGRAARARCGERFDIQGIARSFLEVYRAVRRG
jgi:glycosyltransferase involved in cell wall biosynthesis